MLACKSEELVALGALGNLDAVLVGPLLDLAVGPGVENSVTEALLSSSGGLGSRSIGALGVQASKTSLTTESGNEGITSGRLRSWVATLVEPSLDVRVGPGSVEPVTGVGSGFAELGSSSLVVLADSPDKRVALARLGNGNAILISECLELRVRPAGQC